MAEIEKRKYFLDKESSLWVFESTGKYFCPIDVYKTDVEKYTPLTELLPEPPKGFTRGNTVGNIMMQPLDASGKPTGDIVDMGKSLKNVVFNFDPGVASGGTVPEGYGDVVASKWSIGASMPLPEYVKKDNK